MLVALKYCLLPCSWLYLYILWNMYIIIQDPPTALFDFFCVIKNAVHTAQQYIDAYIDTGVVHTFASPPTDRVRGYNTVPCST